MISNINSEFNSNYSSAQQSNSDPASSSDISNLREETQEENALRIRQRMISIMITYYELSNIPAKGDNCINGSLMTQHHEPVEPDSNSTTVWETFFKSF
jgi:hypothetical protein